MHPEAQKSAQSGMPRRSVLKAGAWSLPVVAAAVATPLAAASTVAQPLSKLMHYVTTDSPVPLSTTDWCDLVYVVANWEAPVTVGAVFLQLTGVANLEFDFDTTATTFDATWNSGTYSYDVANTQWTLSVSGDTALFTTALTLEPGFTNEPPNTSTIAVRVRQRPGATPGLSVLPSQVWDSVTAPDPATVVPLAVLYS